MFFQPILIVYIIYPRIFQFNLKLNLHVLSEAISSDKLKSLYFYDSWELSDGNSICFSPVSCSTIAATESTCLFKLRIRIEGPLQPAFLVWVFDIGSAQYSDLMMLASIWEHSVIVSYLA